VIEVRATFVFVPPGGGEADYQLAFEIPAAPQPGDYVRFMRDGAGPGTFDFIVRRSWWLMTYPHNETHMWEGDERAGKLDTLIVECEFALGPFAHEEHKRACEGYAARGKPLQEFEATAY
jgi:hypothetical protein